MGCSAKVGLTGLKTFLACSLSSHLVNTSSLFSGSFRMRGFSNSSATNSDNLAVVEFAGVGVLNSFFGNTLESLRNLKRLPT
jgi:hypothetical protein